MSEFTFASQGIVVRVRSALTRHAPILSRLHADFAAFAERMSEPAKIVLTLTDVIPADAEKLRPLRMGRLPNADVFGWGQVRICVYRGGVRAESRTRGGVRQFWIAGADAGMVREVAYTAILSALGEELDARGLHRAHALGLTLKGKTLLLLGPSGAGKSSLATLLLRSGARLFSDESPLLDGHSLRPFPLRMALAPEVAARLTALGGETFRRHRFHPKRLFAVRPEQVADPAPLDLVLLAGRRAERPRIRKIGRLEAAAPLFANLVIGLGLAQMTEWMLRADALPRLARIAGRRLSVFLRIWLGQKTLYKFDLSEDPYANAECLTAFVAHKPAYRLSSGLAQLVRLLERPLRVSAFKPLHEMIRLLLLRHGLPWFERVLQERLDEPRLRMIPRHSLLRPGGYQFLRSDVDCSLVVPDEMAPERVEAARAQYERWRRRWWLLGELEIYMEHERRLQLELESSFGPLLERIRLLRKWNYLATEFAGESEYHREKSQLGREATFRQLTGREFSEPAAPQISTALENFLREQFPSAPSVQQPSGVWRSDFLGWELSARETSGALVLTTQLALFLALLPDSRSAPGEWQREMYKFRLQKPLTDAYVAVLAKEYLQCRSVMRDAERDNPELRDWMHFLRDEISVLDASTSAALGPIPKVPAPGPGAASDVSY